MKPINWILAAAILVVVCGCSSSSYSEEEEQQLGNALSRDLTPEEIAKMGGSGDAGGNAQDQAAAAPTKTRAQK